MKARFKTIILAAFGVISAFTAVTFTSCTTDKCKSVVCAYGGVCNAGACLCQSGYEGTFCETISREKFAATWTVVETGTISSQASYTVRIQDGFDNNITSLAIYNFYNKFTVPVIASVKADTIYIPDQQIGDFTVAGHGYLTPDTRYATSASLKLFYHVVNNKTGITNDFGIDAGQPSFWTK